MVTTNAKLVLSTSQSSWGISPPSGFFDTSSEVTKTITYMDGNGILTLSFYADDMPSVSFMYRVSGLSTFNSGAADWASEALTVAKGTILAAWPIDE